MLRFDSVRVQGMLAFLVLYLVWGSTFLAIRYALQTIPPFLTATTRHLVAGLILLGWGWWHGERPSRQAWQNGVILGTLFFLIGHGMLHWAQQTVPSGIAALLIATQPLIIALLMPAFRMGRRPGPSTYVGLAAGTASVLALFRPEVTLDPEMTKGLFAVLLGAAGWAIGAVMSRKLEAVGRVSSGTPTLNLALPLVCGALMLLTVALLRGEQYVLRPAAVTRESLAGLLFLIFFGSLLAFTAFSWLLKHYPPTLVSTYTYVNPIIAVVLGWMFAGERITPAVIVSAVLAIAAIALVNLGAQGQKT
jgi:drug/metabolite transporter (DMT)-like permease